MTLRIRPSGTRGKVHEVTPASAGWSWVGFGLYRLVAGETVAEPTGGTEVILVLVEGRARVGAGDVGRRGRHLGCGVDRLPYRAVSARAVQPRQGRRRIAPAAVGDGGGSAG